MVFDRISKDEERKKHDDDRKITRFKQSISCKRIHTRAFGARFDTRLTDGKYERENVSNSFGVDWLISAFHTHEQFYKRIRNDNWR